MPPSGVPVNEASLALGLVGALALSAATRRGGRAVAASPILRVPVDKLWTRPQKMEETLQDIEAGRLSYSKQEPALVSRLDEPRGHFFVIDGHHRIAEHILDGQGRVGVLVDVHMPRIERTGGAYRRWVEEKVPVAKAVRSWRNESKFGRARLIAQTIRSFANDEADMHVCYEEGLCGDVADYVHFVTLPHLGLECWHEDQLGEKLPQHTWVRDPVTGLHHDLGNPEGVPQGRDLLYFAKEESKWSPGLDRRARFFAQPKSVAEMGDE